MALLTVKEVIGEEEEEEEEEEKVDVTLEDKTPLEAVAEGWRAECKQGQSPKVACSEPSATDRQRQTDRQTDPRTEWLIESHARD